MTAYILSVISACFVIGAVAVTVINRRRQGNARERWIKYITYLLIVYAVIGSIMFNGLFVAVAVLITAFGYYEIFISGSRKGDMMLLAGGMLVYTLVAAGFAGYVLTSFPGALLAAYFLVVLFDGFSQLCGQLFGKRKLAPYTSPNKTVEGFLGGWIITMICSAYIFLGSTPSSWKLMILWIGACPAALAGDLAASYFKRRTGIKDYSDLIPGHGGVLDRFDSMIAVYAFCFFINFITA